MKIVKVLGIVVLVLVVVVVLVVSFSLGSVIKTTVQTLGPSLTGVPVSLEKAKVRVFSGKAHLHGLSIGNPEGFKTPSSFELDKVEVGLVMSSLGSDTIEIREILIAGPAITWEGSLKGSNIGRILKNLESDKPAGEKDEPKEKKTKDEPGAGKKVIIEDFIIRDAKVRVSMTAMQGKAVTLPIPEIHLKDLGKASGGASAKEVSVEVFAALTKAITSVIKGSGALLGQGAGALTEGAETVTKEGVKAAGKAADKIAGEATGVVKEKAGQAGKAVTEGASKALKGLGGILGKGEEEGK